MSNRTTMSIIHLPKDMLVNMIRLFLEEIDLRTIYSLCSTCKHLNNLTPRESDINKELLKHAYQVFLKKMQSYPENFGSILFDMIKQENLWITGGYILDCITLGTFKEADMEIFVGKTSDSHLSSNKLAERIISAFSLDSPDSTFSQRIKIKGIKHFEDRHTLVMYLDKKWKVEFIFLSHAEENTREEKCYNLCIEDHVGDYDDHTEEPDLFNPMGLTKEEYHIDSILNALDNKFEGNIEPNLLSQPREGEGEEREKKEKEGQGEKEGEQDFVKKPEEEKELIVESIESSKEIKTTKHINELYENALLKCWFDGDKIQSENAFHQMKQIKKMKAVERNELYAMLSEDKAMKKIMNLMRSIDSRKRRFGELVVDNYHSGYGPLRKKIKWTHQ